MKKYIIIAGVPRAGKSTISKLIAKKFGYQHISMDSIIAGIEKTFPETGVDTGSEIGFVDNIRYISSKMSPFIKAMMDSGEYDECDYGVVIDMYQILPCDFMTYIDQGKCDLFYFINSDVTAEERLKLLYDFDTPEDYSYHKSDSYKVEMCEEIVEVSHLFENECKKHGIQYFHTSHKRNDVIDSFIDGIEASVIKRGMD